MSSIAQVIAAAQDPILDLIVRLEREIKALKLEIAAMPGPEPGAPGPAGLGIDAPPWQAQVYREGSVVTHFLGQYFKALKDTAQEPGDSPDWQRIGFAGIRWRGELVPGMELQPGDHYREGSSLFLVDYTCTPRLLNHRGERGPRGRQGPPGRGPEPSPAIELPDDLRPLVEAALIDYVVREILPTIREIGERLAALERGRL